MNALKVIIPRKGTLIKAQPAQSLILSNAGIDAIASYLITVEQKGGGLDAPGGQTEAIA